MPYAWLADEPFQRAERMLDAGTLDPQLLRESSPQTYVAAAAIAASRFFYPGAGALGVTFDDARGLIHPGHPTRKKQFLAYALARGVSLLCSCGAIALLYSYLLRHVGLRAAAAGAACLASTMAVVTAAHLALPETLVGLAALWTLVRLDEVDRVGDSRSYAIAGFALGVAVSCKYTAVALVVPAFVVHARRVSLTGSEARAHLRRAAIGVAGAVTGFVMMTPYALVTPTEFYRSLRTLWDVGDLNGEFRWLAYAGELPNLLGWPLLALAAVAVASLLRSRAGHSIRMVTIHGSWVVALWFGLGLFSFWQRRYILPVAPSLALLVGAWVASLERASVTRRRAGYAMTAVVIVYSAGYSATAARMFATDTRYAAGAWIDANVPAGQAVESLTWESEMPYITSSRTTIHRSAAFFDVAHGRSGAEIPFESRGRIYVAASSVSDPSWKGDFTPAQEQFLRRLDEAVEAVPPRLVRIRFVADAPWWMHPVPEQISPEMLVYADPAVIGETQNMTIRISAWGEPRLP